MTNLEKAILKTILYFDIFDYPLTENELWSWLYNYQVQDKLDHEEFKKIICDKSNTLYQYFEKKNSLFFLKGRSELIELRELKRELSLKKIRRARLIGKILAFVPWVKMIALTGDVAYLNAQEDADLDFFIIARKGSIWATRFWCAGLMKILGLRPDFKRQKFSNRACLSFFISEDYLNLEPVLLKDKTEQANDPHFAYWLTQFLILYAEDDLEKKFFLENEWLKKYLPNWQAPVFNFVSQKSILMLLKNIFRVTTTTFEENVYKRIQLKILNQKLKILARQNKDVIINDKMLKLHQNDSREQCRNLFYNQQNKFDLL